MEFLLALGGVAKTALVLCGCCSQQANTWCVTSTLLDTSAEHSTSRAMLTPSQPEPLPECQWSHPGGCHTSRWDTFIWYVLVCPWQKRRKGTRISLKFWLAGITVMPSCLHEQIHGTGMNSCSFSEASPWELHVLIISAHESPFI